MCSDLQDVSAEVIWSEKIGSNVMSLHLLQPEIAGRARPGQFCMLFAGEDGGLPLGRPLAIAGVEGKTVHFLFEIIGRGTRYLSSLCPGMRLRVRGPAGTPFPDVIGEKLWLVAGTLGIAPLLYAYRYHTNHLKEVVLGLPDASWSPLASWLETEVSVPALIYENQVGSVCNPVEYLKEYISEKDEVWCCGPDAMMAAVSREIAPRVRRAMVSLEVRMGCGFGGCLGCSVQLKERKALVCCDGPFFDAGEVLWDENE